MRSRESGEVSVSSCVFESSGARSSDGFGYASGSGASCRVANHRTESRDVERRVPAGLLDLGSGEGAITLDRELHDGDAGHLGALDPVRSDALHHADQVVGAAEVAHVEPRARPLSAARRETEPLAARAGFSNGRSGSRLGPLVGVRPRASSGACVTFGAGGVRTCATVGQSAPSSPGSRRPEDAPVRVASAVREGPAGRHGRRLRSCRRWPARRFRRRA